MTHQTLNLDSQLYEYLLSVSLREVEVLTQLRQETAQYPGAVMQISPEQGQLIAFLITLMGATKALEIGVFKGYSATAIALTLPSNGKLVACDISEKDTKIARKYWQKAGIAHKIDLRLAPALETLDQLINNGEEETFDFAFIDADKSNYDSYYEKCLRLVRQGGLIVIDNVLWYGKVADPTIQDNRTKQIRNLNQKIYQDSRVNLSLIPLGDGLTLAIKK